MNQYYSKPQLTVSHPYVERWFLPGSDYHALFLDAGVKMVWDNSGPEYNVTPHYGVWYPLKNFPMLTYKHHKDYLQEKWPFVSDYSIKQLITEYNKNRLYRSACNIHTVLHDRTDVKVFQANLEGVGEIVMVNGCSRQVINLMRASGQQDPIIGRGGNAWAKIEYRDILLAEFGI